MKIRNWGETCFPDIRTYYIGIVQYGVSTGTDTYVKQIKNSILDPWYKKHTYRKCGRDKLPQLFHEETINEFHLISYVNVIQNRWKG